MHAPEIFRWVVAVVFGLFGWFVISVNFRIVYAWLVRREHHSWIPLVGGFFALAGMALCPLTQVRALAWMPLAIDVGYCISMLAAGLVMACFARGKNEDA
jgi:hypothetical protein